VTDFSCWCCIGLGNREGADFTLPHKRSSHRPWANEPPESLATDGGSELRLKDGFEFSPLPRQ
jgi:hypothetical protein